MGDPDEPSSSSQSDELDVAAGKRRPGRQPHSPAELQCRREELLDAAERAIRRLGYRTSMEAIAAEAGLTKPILYRHFGDKAGLADALANRFTDELTEAVAKAFTATTVTGDGLVRAGMAGFVDFIENQPDVYRFLVHAMFQRGPGLIESRMVTDLAEYFYSLVDPWLRLTRGDSRPARLWCFGFVGLVFAATEWWYIHGDDMTRDQAIDYLTELIWNGLTGPGSNP